MIGIYSRWTSCVALAVALFCFGSGQRAQAQGGPPMLTDDPGTVEFRHWEINLAATTERSRSDLTYEAPLIDMNYGLRERLQLKWEFPWLFVSSGGARFRNAMGRSNLGVKWRFQDEGKRHAAVSTYPQLSFNTVRSSARRGISEEGTELLLPIQIAKSVGPVAMNGDLGYALRDRGANEWSYGLAVGREVSERLEVMGELHGTAIPGFRDSVLLANFGLRLKMSESETLLASIGTGLRGPAGDRPNLVAYLGVQLNR